MSPGWGNFFLTELKWVKHLNKTLLRDHFGANARELVRVRNYEDFNNFPRKGARDEWHSIDFEGLIDYIISLKKKAAVNAANKGYLVDGHFKPYYV